jgi:threonine dehydrogenase-like Zn-dependent dehydrogenase
MQWHGGFMKALTVDLRVGSNILGRFASKLGTKRMVPKVALELIELPEPDLPNPNWVKVRSIMSSISDFEQSLIIDHNYGLYLNQFPFVPGNENLGIITEIGSNVQGLEIGERVIVNPLLSCIPRGILHLCEQCATGNPQYCSNFFRGDIGSGIMIGGCIDTAGGWADSFVAHFSQIRVIAQDMDSETAILIPEFTRALRGALQTKSENRGAVVIIGSGSLSLLLLYAMKSLNLLDENVIVFTDDPHGMNLVRDLFAAQTIFCDDHFAGYDELASFLNSKVMYTASGTGKFTSGAHIVYETTGMYYNIDHAFRITGHNGTTILMSPRQTRGSDVIPLWTKNIHVRTISFSGWENSINGPIETFDMAIQIASANQLPAVVSHKFALQEHAQAVAAIADHTNQKLLKAVFQHVV